MARPEPGASCLRGQCHHRVLPAHHEEGTVVGEENQVTCWEDRGGAEG